MLAERNPETFKKLTGKNVSIPSGMKLLVLFLSLTSTDIKRSESVYLLESCVYK